MTRSGFPKKGLNPLTVPYDKKLTRFSGLRVSQTDLALLCQATEYALKELVGLGSAAQGWVPDFIRSDRITPDEEKALQIVALSHFHCGLAANEMSVFLQKNGNPEFVTCHVGWHYVVKNRHTGLLFDMETWQGVTHCSQLPLARRFRLLKTIGGGLGVAPSVEYETIVKEIFRYSARRLLAIEKLLVLAPYSSGLSDK